MYPSNHKPGLLSIIFLYPLYTLNAPYNTAAAPKIVVSTGSKFSSMSNFLYKRKIRLHKAKEPPSCNRIWNAKKYSSFFAFLHSYLA